MKLLLNDEEIDRVIEMAWEDRTPFEAITVQFGLSEAEVVKLMRNEMKRQSFKRWRKRVHSKDSSKHLKKRSSEISRFKCSRQRLITNNNISKKTY
ncbi:TIGR03643 family protein [Flammeovirga aprica]|uniref:TIGR03643 family protein n=1 Tax=Flammeovirga aprica JL-4 TaxID=694437 RepID=A0A7X9P3Y6_9BACT|nr:TIGR03643 family protein [Flammeovirga aprica]NME68187.1 TIGR03643 family protein [Flammeovirga aprica JL-4]